MQILLPYLAKPYMSDYIFLIRMSSDFLGEHVLWRTEFVLNNKFSNACWILHAANFEWKIGLQPGNMQGCTNYGSKCARRCFLNIKYKLLSIRKTFMPIWPHHMKWYWALVINITTVCSTPAQLCTYEITQTPFNLHHFMYIRGMNL